MLSMDWFKGQFTGNPHIQWENLWFPVVFPLNQSSDVNHFFHRSDHSMKKMIKINGLIRSLKSIFFPKTGAASLEECVLPRHWCPRVCLGGSMGVKEKSWGDGMLWILW
jgi:hypothetical protein